MIIYNKTFWSGSQKMSEPDLEDSASFYSPEVGASSSLHSLNLSLLIKRPFEVIHFQFEGTRILAYVKAGDTLVIKVDGYL